MVEKKTLTSEVIHELFIQFQIKIHGQNLDGDEILPPSVKRPPKRPMLTRRREDDETPPERRRYMM